MPTYERPGRHGSDRAGPNEGADAHRSNLTTLSDDGEIPSLLEVLAADAAATSADDDTARSLLLEGARHAGEMLHWGIARTLIEEARARGITGPADREAAREGTEIRRLSEIDPEAVQWLWEGRIPLGGLTALIGDPGEGKSTVSLAIATAVSLGVPLPGEEGHREPGDVILLSAEDSAAHTIRPRLDGMEADVRRIHILDGIRRADGTLTPLTLGEAVHRGHLREAIEEIRPRLVVIDPVTAYLAATDTHRDADVRTVLAPLAEYADEYDCAIVYIMHLRKGQADRAIYRAGGSIAFIGAARSALLVGRDPDDPTRRAIAHVKSNLSALAEPVGFSLEGGVHGWLGESDLTAERMLEAASGEAERSALEEACEWLAEFLRAGARPANEAYPAARREGITDRTLRRAGARLGISKDREGFGSGSRMIWALPHTGPPPLTSMAADTDGQYDQTTELQRDTPPRPLHTGQVSVLAPMDEDSPNTMSAELRLFCESPQPDEEPEAENESHDRGEKWVAI